MEVLHRGCERLKYALKKTLIAVENRLCEVWHKLLILVQYLVFPSFSTSTLAKWVHDYLLRDSIFQLPLPVGMNV